VRRRARSRMQGEADDLARPRRMPEPPARAREWWDRRRRPSPQNTEQTRPHPPGSPTRSPPPGGLARWRGGCEGWSVRSGRFGGRAVHKPPHLPKNLLNNRIRTPGLAAPAQKNNVIDCAGWRWNEYSWSLIRLRGAALKRIGIAISALGFALAGCATMDVALPGEEGDRLVLAPTAVDDEMLIWEGRSVRWDSLEQDDIRTALSNIEEEVTVEEINSAGQLSLLSQTAGLRRGRYRVTYAWRRFRSQTCDPQNPAAGSLAVGVVMTVVADVTTTAGNVNLSGLLPLAAALERNHVQGRLRVLSYGISSGSASISPYLQSASALTPDAIRRAVESFGVVKAVADTPSVVLTPVFLFMDAQDQGACLRHLQGATPATG